MNELSFENPNPENKKEKVPTPEEVQEVFDTVIGPDAMRCEVRVLEDKDGVYLREVSVKEPDGDIREYLYTREGRFPECKSIATSIEYVTYGKSDMPVGNGSVADYKNGEWVFVEER